MNHMIKETNQTVHEGGVLYVVATPIGNLEDITFRAVRILKEVDMILSEDTRTTKHLLDAYEINTPLAHYHGNATQGKHDFIVNALRDGKKLALVSDAGTPAVSDPGTLLIDMIRAELGDSVHIVPIPGASALTSALSVSGFLGSHIVFLGFLPQKKGRQTALREIANEALEKTFVFFESTHRIEKCMAELAAVLPDTVSVMVCRELTKKFEDIHVGSPADIQAIFASDPKRIKGEFAVVVGKRAFFKYEE
jgi:16S rRNA (cytidine1402-2'-O)-methyltransferase